MRRSGGGHETIRGRKDAVDNNLVRRDQDQEEPVMRSSGVIICKVPVTFPAQLPVAIHKNGEGKQGRLRHGHVR